MAASDKCGVISATECPDKWTLTNLTQGKASHLKYAPIIMESPLNIECKLKEIIPLGSYVKLGEAIGRYGFTAKEDIRTHQELLIRGKGYEKTR